MGSYAHILAHRTPKTAGNTWEEGGLPNLSTSILSPSEVFLRWSRGGGGGDSSGLDANSPSPPHQPLAGGPLGRGFGTRPWWLALLACGGAYWPLALEPSAMTSGHPHYCGQPHCLGWESRMQLLPMASSPDDLISARDAGLSGGGGGVVGVPGPAESPPPPPPPPGPVVWEMQRRRPQRRCGMCGGAGAVRPEDHVPIPRPMREVGGTGRWHREGPDQRRAREHLVDTALQDAALRREEAGALLDGHCQTALRGRRGDPDTGGPARGRGPRDPLKWPTDGAQKERGWGSGMPIDWPNAPIVWPSDVLHFGVFGAKIHKN